MGRWPILTTQSRASGVMMVPPPSPSRDARRSRLRPPAPRAGKIERFDTLRNPIPVTAVHRGLRRRLRLIDDACRGERLEIEADLAIVPTGGTAPTTPSCRRVLSERAVWDPGPRSPHEDEADPLAYYVA